MQLIKVEEKNGEQLVSARDLHEKLGVKSNFTTWIKNRIKKYGFANNIDFTVVSIAFQKRKAIRGGENKVDYILKLDMAKEISMIENNDKGREIRRYFIECEKKLLKSNLTLPKDFETAMLLAIEQHKKIYKLEKIEKDHKLLIQQNERTYKITELATETGFRSAVALNDFLRGRSIQRKVNRTWVLNARYNQLGLVEKKIVDGVYHKDGRPVYDMTFTETGKLFILKEIELAQEGK